MSASADLPLTRGEPPILHESFTSFASDIDLTDRGASGMPRHAAQRLEVHNDQTTTQDIVLRDINGNAATYEVPADSIRVLDGAFTAIESTGTETISSVVAHWWMGPSLRL